MTELTFDKKTNVKDWNASKLVLNAGCGFYAPAKLHVAFRNADWKEIRLDVDERVQPDIVSSITDMKTVAPMTFDAVWCSHNLEHLHTFEVDKALSEFRRVLKPDGFALITSPDLESIAKLVIEGRVEEVAYKSPAGPITALDMIYGHSASIERGFHFMAHHTGFTTETLGRRLANSGFSEVLVTKGDGFDIWALALMPDCKKEDIANYFRDGDLDFFTENQVGTS